MHMSPELDYQSLPVQRALRIRERMQLYSVVSTHHVNPLESLPREKGTKLYWSKVDLAADDDDEPHFCTAQP
jgi:hypothetical protein